MTSLPNIIDEAEEGMVCIPYPTDDMPVTAIAPWFGGKRKLAPRIIAEIGDHVRYWEPFVGGFPVVLVKPPCSMETVNDLHKLVVNLARVICDPEMGPALYKMLRRTLRCEDVFRNSDRIIRDFECSSYEITKTSVYLAYHYFIVSWLGRNGTMGLPKNHNGAYCARYTGKGGHSAKRFRSAISSMLAWRKRLEGVTVLNRDGFELLERIEDAPGTAIYCDPPYLVKGAKYLHDFAAGDHDRLSGLLSRFKQSRVVVSYYDDPRLDTLYPGWTKVKIEVSKSLTLSNGPSSVAKKAIEVLLINGPSYTNEAAMPLMEEANDQ